MLDIPIEDKTIKGYKKIIGDSLRKVLLVIPDRELIGIQKILLLDKCPDEQYKYAGGFYCSSEGRRDVYIELYPPKIIEAIPKFLPRIKFFKEYSIVRMFLHELGHHHCNISDIKNREISANEYMDKYLWKIYGRWNVFFKLMGDINSILYPTLKNERDSI